MTKTLTVALAVILWCAAPADAQSPFLQVAPEPPAPLMPMIPEAPFAPDVDVFLDAPELSELEIVWPEIELPDFEQLTIDLQEVQANLAALDLTAGGAKGLQGPPSPAPVIKGPGGDNLYEQARNFIERDQYERAITTLDRFIARRGDRTDAAMYWKAYSQLKLARTADALATLRELQKQYARSRWLPDARALEVEIKQASGQTVSADDLTDDHKLLVLQGLMRNDPETALPIIEKLLAGTSSVRVKERALFLVSRSRTPRAREVVMGIAKGASNPDLKLTAVRYLGMMSGAENRQALEDIYRSTDDVEMKKAILRSFVMANATDKVATIARSETDADLRRTAIRSLGMSNRPDAAETLVSIYNSATAVDTKRAVIDALGMHRNGTALISLARVEQNAELKTEIVRRLSTMRSPEVRAYLLELLN